MEFFELDEFLRFLQVLAATGAITGATAIGSTEEIDLANGGRVLPTQGVIESNIGKMTFAHEVIRVSRANGLTSYDGAYLELAGRQSLPLATRDQALRRAAIRSGVPLFLDSTR